MFKGRNAIFEKMRSKQGQLAVLVDPEKSMDADYLKKLIEKSEFAAIDYFFIGGSTVTQRQFTDCIQFIKANTSIPLVIFPGASHQIAEEADALLFLNLISGRNPDYLIGHQVQAAPELSEMNIEIIPTGYILVDGGKKTSVQYVSQTNPIPQDQFSIAKNTALAGVMMGNALLYFDAGSGAKKPVPTDWVERIKAITGSTIIVGGGIRTLENIQQLQSAGANIIVIGNHIEENMDFLLDLKAYTAQS
jgi:putative glycerol-1-phosphate prenyltransferase